MSWPIHTDVVTGTLSLRKVSNTTGSTADYNLLTKVVTNSVIDDRYNVFSYSNILVTVSAGDRLYLMFEHNTLANPIVLYEIQSYITIRI